MRGSGNVGAQGAYTPRGGGGGRNGARCGFRAKCSGCARGSERGEIYQGRGAYRKPKTPRGFFLRQIMRVEWARIPISFKTDIDREISIYP